MRILSGHTTSVFTCEVEGAKDPFYSCYHRYGPNNWMVTMGESEETVYYPEEEELEAAFQVWQSQQQTPL